MSAVGFDCVVAAHTSACDVAFAAAVVAIAVLRMLILLLWPALVVFLSADGISIVVVLLMLLCWLCSDFIRAVSVSRTGN